MDLPNTTMLKPTGTFVPLRNKSYTYGITYIAEDNSHIWAHGGDDMKDDISIEEYSSCSNDIV